MKPTVKQFKNRYIKLYDVNNPNNMIPDWMDKDICKIIVEILIKLSKQEVKEIIKSVKKGEWGQTSIEIDRNIASTLYGYAKKEYLLKIRKDKLLKIGLI
jgi:hypothetical protein